MGMVEALRIEWARARTRAWRWTEQVDLVEEEMRRVLQFLDWKAEWWLGLKGSAPHSDGGLDPQRGIHSIRPVTIGNPVRSATTFPRELAAEISADTPDNITSAAARLLLESTPTPFAKEGPGLIYVVASFKKADGAAFRASNDACPFLACLKIKGGLTQKHRMVRRRTEYGRCEQGKQHVWICAYQVPRRFYCGTRSSQGGYRWLAAKSLRKRSRGS
ncbi:hypothetical protein K438DRAFT_1974947 [Mycena galopus ATCC 62051]|nr:hypothetical protein K438DRAFT_1974947 [Mycena galopus ATCC 62051]